MSTLSRNSSGWYNEPVKLVRYPDPLLREVARPVERIDGEVRRAAAAMFEVMYGARGIGLAAPQAGWGGRLVVANLSADPERKDQEQIFINPQILECFGEKCEEEGCLSLPGMSVKIPRAERVEVRYQDLEGREIRRLAEGVEAKLFQHEIDHLDGILIIDKMTPADRKQWASFLKGLEREYRSRARRGRSAPSQTAR